jgi:hypothetical protein
MNAKITGGLMAALLAVSLMGGTSAHTRGANFYTRDRAGDLVEMNARGQIVTWFCILDHKVYALADLPQVHGCAYARSVAAAHR